MQALSRISEGSAPIVVARRWDGLGGRMNALLNGWSIARALDLEFRFVWPQGYSAELGDPRNLFSADFLQRFLIDPSAISDRKPVSGFRPNRMTRSAARDFLRSAEPPALAYVKECFDVISFQGEDDEGGGHRFRACFHDLGWSDDAHRVVTSCATWRNDEGCFAVHIRAGDIVSGAWRSFLAHEKYTPTPFIAHAIETLSDGGQKPVVIVSDNDELVAFLRGRYDLIRRPRDIVPDYDRWSDLQRALADSLLLSRCQGIVGPPYSAFSRLGANLAGVGLVPADRLAPADRAHEIVRAGIEQGLSDTKGWGAFRSLLSRDICWYLDVFGEELPKAERRDWARRAVHLEPDFCGAVARLARISALAGATRDATRASARALGMAEAVEVHDDPAVESLATTIMVGCIALTDKLQAQPGGRWRGLFGGRLRDRRLIERLRQQLARCEGLSPTNQMRFSEIRKNLSYQIAAVEWLDKSMSRKGARPAMIPMGIESIESDLAGLRKSALACSRAARFDPVLRDLETVSVWLARIIGSAAAAPGRSGAPAAGIIDRSPAGGTGLQWMTGRIGVASDNAPRAVCIRSERSLLYGGPLGKVQAAADRGPEPALEAACSFSFPAPRLVGRLQPSDLVVLSPSGARRPVRSPGRSGGIGATDKGRAARKAGRRDGKHT